MSYLRDPIFQTIECVRRRGELEQALDEAWRRWSQAPPSSIDVRSLVINYKPFERARILVEAQVADRSEAEHLALFLHVHGNEAAARREAVEGWKQGFVACPGPPMVLILPWSTVAWTLPNGSRLPELGWLTDPDNIDRLLGRPSDRVVDNRPQLLSCVPYKRATLDVGRWRQGRRCLAELFRKPAAERVARNLQLIGTAVERGELEFESPRLLAFEPSCRAVFTSSPGGVEATETDPGPELFGRIGRALASLHQSSIRPAAMWTAARELEKIDGFLPAWQQAVPSEADRLERLRVALHTGSRSHGPSEVVPIHGSMTGRRLLLHGDDLSLVGWQNLCLGDRLFDLGRLIADFIYRADVRGDDPRELRPRLDALTDAYQQRAARSLDRQRLSWHVAAALLWCGKAYALRRLPPGWVRRQSLAIAGAERVLLDRSPFLGARAAAV